MKAIFLDIDGVLNSDEHTAFIKSFVTYSDNMIEPFDDECLHNLKYIVFGKNVKVINDGLLGGSKIEQIEFNDGLEKLGSNVSGVGLKSKIDVSIPESVTEMTFRGAKTLIVKSGSYAESYAKEYADKLGMAYKVE